MSGVVTITGTAISNTGAVISVDSNFNGGSWDQATDTPEDCSWSTWEYIWDTREFDDGQYVIIVKAIDENSGSDESFIIVTVDNFFR